jgi:hypothetical protein
MKIPYKSQYEWHLQSEDFNKVKQQAFKRDGYKCVACGSTEHILAHHLTYRNVPHEDPRDLATLCDRCHTIHHSILNLEKAVNDYYAKTECEGIEARKEQIREERAYRERIGDLFVKRFLCQHLDDDYAKNGDFDMMNWSVLKPIIAKDIKYFNENIKDPESPPIDEYYFDKMSIYHSFMRARLEFVIRCLDKGISFQRMVSETKFSASWLRNWYNRAKAEAKLKELETIESIKKEETT